MSGDIEKTVRQTCRAKLIPLQYVPKEKLNSLTSNATHQGVVAQLSMVDYLSIQQVLPHLYESGVAPCVLVLDGIEDVRNIGALARSAVWFDIHAIVVSIKKTARINSFAMKASAGALKDIPVCREKNLKEALEFIKASGLQVVVADSETSETENNIDYSEPIALVLGSENKGVSKQIKSMADGIARIPGSHKVESLNVSTAGAILMYDFYRKRNNLK